MWKVSKGGGEYLCKHCNNIYIKVCLTCSCTYITVTNSNTIKQVNLKVKTDHCMCKHIPVPVISALVNFFGCDSDSCQKAVQGQRLENSHTLRKEKRKNI